MGQCFRVETRLIHVVLSQGMVHPNEQRMLLPQPSPARLVDEVDRSTHIFRSVLDEPLDLRQVALVSELAGQLDLVKSRVELVVLVRSDEVEEVLADGVVDGVVLEEEEVGLLLAGLAGHHAAQMAEVLGVFLL